MFQLFVIQIQHNRRFFRQLEN